MKTWWFILTPLITIQLTSLKSPHQLNQIPRFTLTLCSFEGYHRLAKYVTQGKTQTLSGKIKQPVTGASEAYSQDHRWFKLFF